MVLDVKFHIRILAIFPSLKCHSIDEYSAVDRNTEILRLAVSHGKVDFDLNSFWL